MGKVTTLAMDVVTNGSGHMVVGMAVSVCLTPMVPAPVPIPYPCIGTVGEGITDPAMRTKIEGNNVMTVGSSVAACHGNEPGALKEIVSMNTGGPCVPLVGAPLVFTELGMTGMTLSMGIMNKTGPGAAISSASGAGNASSAGGGSADPGSSSDPDKGKEPEKHKDEDKGNEDQNKPKGADAIAKTQAQDEQNKADKVEDPATKQSKPTEDEIALAKKPGDSPEQQAAREKVSAHYFKENGMENDYPQCKKGIDFTKPVEVKEFPLPNQLTQNVRKKGGYPGNWFDPKGDQTGDQLGLNDDSSVRVKRNFDVPQPGKFSALQSTAAPITDDWTDPSKPVVTKGGGTQWTVSNGTKDAIRNHNPYTPPAAS